MMPPHSVYIEHLGGGAMMKRKPPALRTIGIDLNGRAIEAFRCDYEVELVHGCAHRFLGGFPFDGSELVYSDPPYLRSTRKSDRRYRHDYEEADHEALLALLKALPCAAMVSGYPSALYDDRLGGWGSVSLQAMNRAGVVTEKVWFNFGTGPATRGATSLTARASSARPRTGAAATARCPRRSAWRCWRPSWRSRRNRREAFDAPSGQAAGVPGPTARPAPGPQPAVHHAGHRPGGVVGVLHAIALFPGAQRTLAEQRGRSNAHTLFGLTRMPCDNHIRQLLDGVPPDRFDELFQHIVEDLDAAGGLDRMRRLDGRVLIALDGTPLTQDRLPELLDPATPRRWGRVLPPGPGRHPGGAGPCPGAAAAAGVHPPPGRPRQAGLRTTGRQALVRRLGPRYGALRPVYLGDDLYACQPVCEAIRAVGGRFILTCKPHSHETLYEYLHGIALKTHRTVVGRGRQRRIHRYRFMTGLPIRDGDDALRVNWFEIEIARNGAVTYRNAFVTDLAVNRDT